VFTAFNQSFRFESGELAGKGVGLVSGLDRRTIVPAPQAPSALLLVRVETKAVDDPVVIGGDVVVNHRANIAGNHGPGVE
jgi:hypothetical protein